MTAGQVQDAFSAWSAAVRGRRQVVETVTRVLRIMTSAKVVLAWRAWVLATNTTQGMSRGVRIMVRVVNRMLLAKLGVAFGTWNSLTRELAQKQMLGRVAKNLVVRTARRMVSAKVGRAWQSWITLVRMGRQHDAAVRVLHRAVQRWRLNAFGQGFSSWRLAVREGVREEEARNAEDRIQELCNSRGALMMRHALQRLPAARMGRGFTSWRLAVRMAVHEGDRHDKQRQVATAQIARCVYRLAVRRLSAGWSAWVVPRAARACAREWRWRAVPAVRRR